MAASSSQPAKLSEDMLRVIRGEVGPEEKKGAYNQSLHKWWKEYSHRKNDEDDMVADSLLYDERCHLPRTTPGPKSCNAELEPEVIAQQDGCQQQQH
eukprot:jgi/Chrzof1/8337/Cz03g06200.t1